MFSSTYFEEQITWSTMSLFPESFLGEHSHSLLYNRFHFLWAIASSLFFLIQLYIHFPFPLPLS